jgi:predicted small lipoprotein YifL
MFIRVSPDEGNLCMVRPALGISIVKSKRRLSPSGWAIIVLSATALALGGCGRKAGLDLPPNAMNAASDTVPETEVDRGGAPPSVVEQGPVASKGRKKPFVLDPLLGN